MVNLWTPFKGSNSILLIHVSGLVHTSSVLRDIIKGNTSSMADCSGGHYWSQLSNLRSTVRMMILTGSSMLEKPITAMTVLS